MAVRLILTTTLILALLSNLWAQEEYISNFISTIEVNPDRSILVTETITVRAEGINIKRGIYRELQLNNISSRGIKVTADYEILEVMRDGKPETYNTESMRFGERIYIGEKDVFLDPGTYTYTLRYRIYNQVRFFEDYDEIYFNVVGETWVFPIKKAVGIVVVPEGAEISQRSSYSGYYGEEGCNCSDYLEDSRKLVVTMQSELSPGEQFTIAAGFTKGYVVEPTAEELAVMEASRNKVIYFGVGGFLFIVVYYFVVWLFVGKDPRRGTIIPLYNAPDGLGPAACRTLLNMKYDKKGFTSSLVNIAVKGAITIEKEDKPWYAGGDTYTLVRTGENMDQLNESEKKILDRLLSGKTKYELKTTNYYNLEKAIDDHEKGLRKEYDAAYYKLNQGWIAPGIFLSFGLVIGILIFTGFYDENTLFAELISIMAMIFFLSFLIPILIAANKSSGFKKMFLLLIGGGIAVFMLFQISQLWTFEIEDTYLDNQIITGFPVIILLLIVAGVIFFRLVKAPSVSGRLLMDKIEGLKMYLSITESDRLKHNLKNDLSIIHFEAMLPYAIALDVEKNWTDRFSEVLTKALNNGSYTHPWYHTKNGSFNVDSFTRDIGQSFSSAVTTNSSPPGSSGSGSSFSSSGSSGGGFSGGGSGGGGGGGW